MDKKLLFNGGEPNITTDDIMRQPFANTAAIYGMAQGLGAETSNFIISGVEAGAPVAGNVTFSAGYIFLNGEVVQVDTQTIAVLGAGEKYKIEKVVSYESGGDKTFLDGTPRQTWQKNRGVISKVPVATVVELTISFSTRLKYMIMPIIFNRKITKPAGNTGENFELFEIPSFLDQNSDISILEMLKDFSLIRHESIAPYFSINYIEISNIEIYDDGGSRKISLRFIANTTVQTDFYIKFSLYPNIQY